MQDKNLSTGAAGDDPQSLEKKSLLSRLEQDLKQGIFNAIYVLLKDSDIGLVKFSVLLFIEFL